MDPRAELEALRALKAARSSGDQRGELEAMRALKPLVRDPTLMETAKGAGVALVKGGKRLLEFGAVDVPDAAGRIVKEIVKPRGETTDVVSGATPESTAEPVTARMPDGAAAARPLAAETAELTPEQVEQSPAVKAYQATGLAQPEPLKDMAFYQDEVQPKLKFASDWLTGLEPAAIRRQSERFSKTASAADEGNLIEQASAVLKAVMNDPTQIGLQAAESLPSMLVPLAVGKSAAGMAATRSRLVSKTMNMNPAMSELVAMRAGQKAGTAAGSAAAGLQSGQGAADDFAAGVDALTDAELVATSPAVRKAVSDAFDPELSSADQQKLQAKTIKGMRERIKAEGRTTVLAMTGLISALSSRVTGEAEFLTRLGTAKGAATRLGAIASGTGEGMVKEGAQEFFESGVSEKGGQNVAARTTGLDPNRPLGEGVTSGGLQGALAGTVMGAGGGAVGGFVEPLQAAPQGPAAVPPAPVVAPPPPTSPSTGPAAAPPPADTAIVAGAGPAATMGDDAALDTLFGPEGGSDGSVVDQGAVGPGADAGTGGAGASPVVQGAPEPAADGAGGTVPTGVPPGPAATPVAGSPEAAPVAGGATDEAATVAPQPPSETVVSGPAAASTPAVAAPLSDTPPAAVAPPVALPSDKSPAAPGAQSAPPPEAPPAKGGKPEDKMARIRRERDEKRAALKAAVVDDRLELVGEGDRTGLISPDASNPGKLRLTWFDKDGPGGHVVVNSVDEAVQEALAHRFQPKRAPQESQDDISRREYAENYDRVSASPDFKDISDLDLERARNFAQSILATAWNRPEMSKATLDGLQREKEHFEAEMKRRKEAKGKPPEESRPFKPILQRQQNARDNFVQNIVEQFGLTEEQASKAAAELHRTGLVKWDANSGQAKLKDGRAWDKAVMRRAAGLEETVDTAAHEAATSPNNDLPEPTPAQTEAENTKMGHTRIDGLDITIQHPEGSRRKKGWQKLKDHYGRILGHIGRDGEHLDVFVKPGTPAGYTGPVFVVDQQNAKGKYDESKVMMGYANTAEAEKAYRRNYPKDFTGFRAITPMTSEEFKAFLADPKNLQREATVWAATEAKLASKKKPKRPPIARPPPPPKGSAAELAMHSRQAFLAEVRKRGFIDRAELPDIMGEGRRNKGTGAVHTKAGGLTMTLFKPGGMGVDMLREILYDLGYITDQEGDVTGSANETRDIVRAILDNVDESASIPMTERDEYEMRLMQESFAAEYAAEAALLPDKHLPGLTVEMRADNLLTEDELEDLARQHPDDATYYPALKEAIRAKRDSIEDQEGGEARERDPGRPETAEAGRGEVQGEARAGEQAVDRADEGEAGGEVVRDLPDPAPPLELESQSEEDLQKRAEDARAAEREEKQAAAKAEEKARADTEAKDFRLTGSDRPADVAMAGGQKSIFARGGSAGGTTRKQVRGKLITRLGRKVTNRLLSSGKVNVVQAQAELPNGPYEGKVRGLRDGNGNVWLVADNLDPNQVLGALLHELGVHEGERHLQTIMGKRWQSLVDRFNHFRTNGTEEEKAIAQEAERRAQAEMRLREKEGKPVNDYFLNHERIAHFVELVARDQETHPEPTGREKIRRWLAEVMQSLKEWVRGNLTGLTDLDRRAIVGTLTPNDFVTIARLALEPKPSRAPIRQRLEAFAARMNPQVGERSQEMRAAAQQLKEGKITREEYERVVKLYKPIRPYTSVPTPNTTSEVKAAVNAKQSERVGQAHATLKGGEDVGLRLDIPAYTNNGVWVIAVHEKGVGSSIGYEPVASVTNATMGMSQKQALTIAAGGAKAPLAAIRGAWKPITPEQAKATAEAALNDPSWAQVGMDPVRHGYFYDRKTGEPIVAGDEVVQIGPLVLVKNPKYAPKSDFLFARGDEPTTRAENLQRWAKGTKVVDQNGQPLVVYHGTSSDTDFKKFRIGQRGAWFGESPDTASMYATSNDSQGHVWDGRNFIPKNTKPRIYPVYLNIQNPYTLTEADWTDLRGDSSSYQVKQRALTNRAKAMGHDGINYGDGVWVAFRPEQIKSAVGNKGTYDPRTGDIMLSRSDDDTTSPREPYTIKWKEKPDGSLRANLDPYGLNGVTLRRWPAGKVSLEMNWEGPATRKMFDSEAQAKAAAQEWAEHQLDVRGQDGGETAAAMRERAGATLMSRTDEDGNEKEHEEGDDDVTAIKNRETARRREEFSIPAARKAAVRSFGHIWDMANPHGDWSDIDALVSELTHNPRSVSDLEDAMLLYKQIQLQSEHDKVMAQIEAFAKDGDQADMTPLQLNRKRIEEALEVLYDVGKAVGTATARGLNARKILAAYDYSLVAMKARVRAENQGNPHLFEDEKGKALEAELRKKADRIKELEDKLAAAEKAKDDKAAQDVFDQTDLGLAGGQGGDRARGRQKAKDIIGQLRQAVEDGETPETMGNLIQRLARAVVEAGERNREEMLTKVHTALMQLDIQMTRREVQDAISGYGNFSELTKDEVSVVLRGMKGELQQLAKIQDMLAGMAPSKTGQERREPTDEERRLIKIVNDLKKRLNLQTTDPAKQLKTALQTIKTRLQNQITDLQNAIDKREKLTRDTATPPTDNEVLELKRRRDALKDQYDTMFPADRTLTEEERVARAEASIERAIEDLEQRIKDGDIFNEPRKQGPTSDKITALKSQLKGLKGELQGLRDASPEYQAHIEELHDARVVRTRITRLTNQIALLEGRRDRKDFADPVKKPPVPATPEQRALEFERDKVKKEFHELVMAHRIANWSNAQKVWNGIREITGLTRGLMTMVDFSAVLRQGAFVVYGHPIRAAKALPAMFKASVSEEAMHAMMADIMKRDNARNGLYQRSGLSLADPNSLKISQREEVYVSKWLEKVWGLKVLYKGSERAYTMFLNRLRADSFDAMVATLPITENVTGEEAKGIAYFVNNATGRGSVFGDERATEFLNTALFSPRYLTSRFAMFGMRPFIKAGSKAVQKQVAVEYIKYAAGLTVVWGLAAAAAFSALDDDDKEKWKEDFGSDKNRKDLISFDPRRSDFGKVKFGDATLDPLSGWSQIITLIGRVGTGETVTQKGKMNKLDTGKWGDTGRWEVIGRFIRSKLAPGVSVPVDFWAGTNFLGEPTPRAETAINALTPMSLQDAWEIWADEKADGEAAIDQRAMLTVLSIMGMSVQTRAKGDETMAGWAVAAAKGDKE